MKVADNEPTGYKNLVNAAIDWCKNENLQYRNAVHEVTSQDVGVANSKIIRTSDMVICEKYPAYVVTNVAIPQGHEILLSKRYGHRAFKYPGEISLFLVVCILFVFLITYYILSYLSSKYLSLTSSHKKCRFKTL